jgi:hypothetical protein
MMPRNINVARLLLLSVLVIFLGEAKLNSEGHDEGGKNRQDSLLFDQVSRSIRAFRSKGIALYNRPSNDPQGCYFVYQNGLIATRKSLLNGKRSPGEEARKIPDFL